MAHVEASNRCSNPSRNVRIIGKIRGLTHTDYELLGQGSRPWISVKNPEANGSSEKCEVCIETQSTRKDSYELDYCYEQHEELDWIYSREIRPLVLELFEGRNASIIALGAKGSGKTYTIQGSEEKPGLAVMAMCEILAKAKELGMSVSISLYDITQENVKDLLNPDRPAAIKVLDDAHGKANIIGLSKVPVNSITEFHTMYFSQCSSQNTQKVVGLMVHITSDDDKMKAKPANKINFVDLAGSLYALLDVINAVSANDAWVPYRKSKLTRILQDSLCGENRILLLTCLNPCFCQDSLSYINLISRSYRTIKQVLIDSIRTNKSRTSAKVKVPSSAYFTAKTSFRHNLKGRKLFDGVKKDNSKQLRCQSEDNSRHKSKSLRRVHFPVAPFSLEVDASHLNCSSSLEKIEELSECMSNLDITDDSTTLIKKDCNLHDLEGTLGAVSDGKDHMQSEAEAASMCEDGLLSLKERIKEVYNNLKALGESTPSIINMPVEMTTCNNQVSYNDNQEPSEHSLVKK